MVAKCHTSGGQAAMTPFKALTAEAWFQQWEELDNTRQTERSEATLAAMLGGRVEAASIPNCDVVLESVPIACGFGLGYACTWLEAGIARTSSRCARGGLWKTALLAPPSPWAGSRATCCCPPLQKDDDLLKKNE